jgi:MFS family permease
MIAGRALKGIGAAAMIPGSLALIARAYPRADRGRAIGIWAAASALTTALGPILGGVALSLGGPEVWRLLFAINLPLGALALWLLWRHVREDPPGQPQPARLARRAIDQRALAFSPTA